MRATEEEVSNVVAVMMFMRSPQRHGTFATWIAGSLRTLPWIDRALVCRRAARCRAHRTIASRPCDRFEVAYEADALLDRFGAQAIRMARRYRNEARQRDDLDGVRLWSAVRLHLVRLVFDGACCAWTPDYGLLDDDRFDGVTGPEIRWIGRRPAEARRPVAARAARPSVVRRLRPRLV